MVSIFTKSHYGNLALPSRLFLLCCWNCCLRLVPFVQCAILFVYDACVDDCTPFKGLEQWLMISGYQFRVFRSVFLCRTRGFLSFRYFMFYGSNAPEDSDHGFNENANTIFEVSNIINIVKLCRKPIDIDHYYRRYRLAYVCNWAYTLHARTHELSIFLGLRYRQRMVAADYDVI